MTEPFQSRVEACKRRLGAVGADAAVFFPGPNLYYLSGFMEEPGERHLLLFVPREGEPTFVLPEMYVGQVRDASGVEAIRSWADGEDPTALIDDVVDDLGLAGGEVLLDDRMWELFSQDVRSCLPDASFGLASEVTEDLRIRKDETELDALRRAAELADEVCVAVRELGADAVGMTEAELAGEIERRLDAAGGGELSFETIVGAGPNGAKPHYRHGDREIRAGEPVVLDFGARVDHYPGDQTRTVVFDGDPGERFREAHGAVLDALEAGIDAVEPGVEAQAVDRAARAVIEDRGFGEQFIHRTGHGIGLEVHEPPYVVEGNDRELEAGMAFSVEPGIYVEGEFGVRIEDIVAVTEEGCERLNDTPRTWEPL